jgi:hypothetical protein
MGRQELHQQMDALAGAKRMNLLGALAIAILWPVLAVICLAAFVCSCVSDGVTKWATR